MPGELIVKNGLRVSGSIIATAGLTGSFSGSITNATTASYALTASVLLGSVISASFASTASYWSGSILNATSASYALTASNSLTASFASTSSFPWFRTGSNIAYVGGNVGIGTATPSAKLTVNGIVSATNESFNPKEGAIVGNGGNPSFVQILSRSAGGYAYALFNGFAVNTTTGLSSSILDYGVFGDVQSGTTAPTVTYSYFGVGSSVAYNNTHLRIYNNANKLITVDGNLNIGSTDNPGHKLFIKGSGTTSATIPFRIENSGATASMVIRDDNCVGISTATPGDKLEVGGNVYAHAFNSIGTLTRYNSTGGIAIAGLAGNPYAYISAYSNSGGAGKNLALQINGGNVGINNTNPNYRLDVSGSGNFTSNLTITGSVIATSFTGSLLGTASNALYAAGAGSATSASYALTASYWSGSILNATSASYALTSSVAVSSSFAVSSSRAVSSSFTSTASFVNTLNQNVLITGSAVIGTSSLGPNENTLTLGARDTTNEGGQLGFNAPGGTYTSASFIDLYQNRIRILKGTNAGSTAEVANWSMHSLQMSLPAYNNASAFPGTSVANLEVDSGGNIITTAPVTPVTGYTGIVTIIGNPPGQQNLDFQNGILTNVF